MDATLDEVWKLIKETDAQIKETGAQMKASDEKLTRLIELGDRRHAETEAAMARSRAETEAAMARSRAETEAAMARSRAETEAAFRELSRKMGKLSDRVGEFAEGMVIPAARRLFAERGIAVHRLHRHVEVRLDDKAAEFDILLVNARHVVAIEVKSRLKVSDVRDHLERMAAFKAYFPEYADRAALGAVAGMVVDEEAARFAYRQGLFVLAQTGDTVQILNDDTFRPKTW